MRDRVIRFRVSAKELQTVQRAAKRVRRSPSDWCRVVILVASMGTEPHPNQQRMVWKMLKELLGGR